MYRRHSVVIGCCLVAVTCSGAIGGDGSKVVVGPNGVLVVDGKPTFPIGFTMPPPPDGKTPDGRDGFAELRSAGATFLRTGVMAHPWNDEAIEQEQRWQDAAARNGMHCWVALADLGTLKPEDANKEARLRRVIERFRGHPGMGVWKGVDEPEWGKQPAEGLIRAYQIIHELDPNHPVGVTQAPRGTVKTLRPYNAAADIIGADIYPVGYPPGAHSLLPNKEISMVGDYTRTMMEVGEGQRPVWMILQIAWSGVLPPNKTLRFPTFAQERFMAYQAIINGARGLIFFGGHITKAMPEEDAALGWNWTFWRRVLRPVIEEIGDKGPLYPALVAPNSMVQLEVTDGEGIEWLVRETEGAIFLLACKREGATVRATFRGLPDWVGSADVLFESPRKVEAKNGELLDWFAPFDVHVYRFSKPAGN